jgi:fructose-bisphosphate aldolase class 1
MATVNRSFKNMSPIKIISSVQGKLLHFKKDRTLYDEYTDQALKISDNLDELIKLSQEYWKKAVTTTEE